MHAHDLPSVRMRSARGAARSTTERKMIKGTIGSWSSSSSASENSAVRRNTEGRRRVIGRGEYKHEKLRGNGSTRAGRGEPDVALSLAPVAERFSEFESLDRVAAHRTYNSKNFCNAVIELTSSGTWQKVSLPNEKSML